MTDILHNLMYPLPNAIMTVIIGILALYWLFAFISGIGFDAFDVDIDFDADVDTPDVSAEGDSDVATEKEPGFWVKAFHFLNIGRVPFMLIITIFKLFMWIGTLVTTSVINVLSWGLWSLFILIPIGIIALFFTKLTTNPMAKFFKEIGYKGEEEIDFLGRSAKMLSNIKDKKIGIAEVVIDKNPMKLNVISLDGTELKYGDYVIIEDESDDRKVYYVSKEISIRNL